jgi:hypothetical protein
MLEEIHALRNAIAAAEFPEGPQKDKGKPLLDPMPAMLLEARLENAVIDAITDLEFAYQAFRAYETMHRDKGTAKSLVKAEANRAIAERLRATIVRVRGALS